MRSHVDPTPRPWPATGRGPGTTSRAPGRDGGVDGRAPPAPVFPVDPCVQRLTVARLQSSPGEVRCLSLLVGPQSSTVTRTSAARDRHSVGDLCPDRRCAAMLIPLPAHGPLPAVDLAPQVELRVEMAALTVGHRQCALVLPRLLLHQCRELCIELARRPRVNHAMFRSVCTESSVQGNSSVQIPNP